MDSMALTSFKMRFRASQRKGMGKTPTKWMRKEIAEIRIFETCDFQDVISSLSTRHSRRWQAGGQLWTRTGCQQRARHKGRMIWANIQSEDCLKLFKRYPKPNLSAHFSDSRVQRDCARSRTQHSLSVSFFLFLKHHVTTHAFVRRGTIRTTTTASKKML